jgi:hypothetical protein
MNRRLYCRQNTELRVVVGLPLLIIHEVVASTIIATSTPRTPAHPRRSFEATRDGLESWYGA